MDEYILTFVIGFLASILSGIAGGGSGFITAPLFILMGLSPQVAIATAKFSGLGIALGGFFTFRETEFIRWQFVLYLSVLATIAAIAGSFLLLSLNEQIIEKTVGILMLISLPFLLFNKKAGIYAATKSRLSKIVGGFMFFSLAFLQSSFGSGIGTLIPIVMTNLFGFTALEANATRKIPGIIIAVVPLIIFISSTIVNYKLGICILIGTYLGSSVGTKISIKKGNSFAKMILTIVVVLLAIKLLLF